MSPRRLSDQAAASLGRLLLMALVLAAACAGRGSTGSAPAAVTPAPPPSQPTAADPADPAATAPMPLDPAVRVGQLDNGLRYYLRPHRQPQHRAVLRLVVNAGSVLEADEQRGLAHFVEHMAFNGTRRFPKLEIVDYLERVGMRFGADANASTSFDETIYTFTVPTDDRPVLAKALAILQQIAHAVTFDPGEVDRERGVVIEEWRLGLGAEMRVLEQVLPVVFAGSRYAERMPIGQRSVLEGATSADLRRFYERWYRPDLMAVIAVGDFDVAAVEAELRAVFAAIPRPATPANRPTPAIPKQPRTRVAVGQDPALTSTSVSVLHKLPRRPETSEGDYRRFLVERLFQQMLNARLEERARSRPPPFLFAASTTQDLVRPLEVFAQVARVQPDGVAAGVEALAGEVERVDRYGFTAGELARAKAERLRQMQALATERENLPADAFADEMVRHHLTGEAIPGTAAELRLHERYLPTVTAEEMGAIARDWFGEEDRVLLVEAPASAPVPPQADLLAVFRTVERSELEPYEDRVAAGPLVELLPPAGRIAGEQAVAPLGITEWRLSNGVRVIVKPTDFKHDEVLVGAISGGGTSRVSDRSFPSARFAAEIVGSSGLGHLDPTELRNALAGKLAEVTPFIEEASEGVLGRASPQDLETLLQLMYLTFAAPRRDEGVFGSFRAQLRERLGHRDRDPDALFADRREALLYRNHPRRRPLEVGDELALSLDEVMEVYRARFDNAADFTFVFVGRVAPELLAPLVARYLGALPAEPGQRETARDRGVRPIGGVRRFQVHAGLEPRSQVSLTFTGTQPWSETEEHLFETLREVVGIRLREVLREGMSGTYGVRVSGALAREPRQEFRADVTFGCAPDAVQAMIAATFRELTRARAGRLAPSYLEKVRAGQRRALQVALATNEFWLRELLEHYRHGSDPALILRRAAWIEQVTVGQLAQAARRYFDEDRQVLGVLRPERPAISARQAAGR